MRLTELFEDEGQRLRQAEIEALEAFNTERSRANLEAVWTIRKAIQQHQEKHYPTAPEPVTDNPEGYAGQHSAPEHDSGSPLYDVTLNGTYPKDFYNLSHQYVGNEIGEQASLSTVFGCRNRPNLRLTIYRAIPKNIPRKINPGDWIAISKAYAVDHGRTNLRNDYVIVTKTVAARDVFTAGDSIAEWGYDPQPPVKRKAS